MQDVWCAFQAPVPAASRSESHTPSLEDILNALLSTEDLVSDLPIRHSWSAEGMISQHLMRIGMGSNLKKRVVEQIPILGGIRLQGLPRDEKGGRQLVAPMYFNNLAAGLKAGR